MKPKSSHFYKLEANEHEVIRKKIKTTSNINQFYITDSNHNHAGFLWSSLKYIYQKNLLVSADVEGKVHIWDAHNQFSPVSTIKPFSRALPIYSIEYIPKSNRLVFGSNESLPLVISPILRKSKSIKLSTEHKFFNFFGLQYIEKDNILIAGGYEKLLLFFDLKTKMIVETYNVGNSISVIKYIPHHEILIIGLWGGIKLFDLRRKQLLTIMKANTREYVMSIEYIDSSGLLYTADDLGLISVWKITKDRRLKLLRKIQYGKGTNQLRNVCRVDDSIIFFQSKTALVFINLLTGKIILKSSYLNTEKEVILYIPEKDGLVVGNNILGLRYIGNFKLDIGFDNLKERLKGRKPRSKVVEEVNFQDFSAEAPSAFD